jgi:hypothetical protein
VSASSRLTVAVRAHTTHAGRLKKESRKADGPREVQPYPRLALVLDCETTTDASQRLRFGFYRLYDHEELLLEGVFHADDLTQEEVESLRQYCRSHREGDAAGGEPLQLNTREQFLKDVFMRYAYDGRAAVVGFNLPFDISRLAVRWGKARGGATKGGFSFVTRTYKDKKGRVKQDGFFPRIAVKSIDNKRAIPQFTSAWQKEYMARKQGNRELTFRGWFVDCRTLAYALTGESHSLESACLRFGVENLKLQAADRGTLTKDYLDYARRGVLATSELYQKLLQEFRRHPIELTPNRAYSPATIGKAYLKAMGIHLPRLRVEKKLRMSRAQVQGWAMTAYYGGRAGCRNRRVPLPVVYLDFLSTYPTVNSLMGLWGFVTAEEIEVIDATEEVTGLLDRITAEDLFDPASWQDLPALVEVLPEDDLLPVRADYSQAGNGQYSIGLTRVKSKTPLCYTLADCIASKLHTGKPPKVIRAIRFRPKGKQARLKEVDFGGSVHIDPKVDDFFRAVIEARYSIKQDEGLDPQERERLQHALKILANSTSYGIFIELNRQENPGTEIKVYGAERFDSVTDYPEEAGPFYFPILGCLLTGAARLMLTLAELEVQNRGGTFAFVDTDSIAVVANENGGLVRYPGGTTSRPRGLGAIKALSWAQVEEIRLKFARLNPYDRGIVPGSILRLEDENYAPGEARERKQLWCFCVSSKRYALFNLEGREPVMRKCSEHGLGYYLPPVDPLTGAPVHDWIEQAWGQIVCPAMGLRRRPRPLWAGQLAHTRVSITTPGMMNWFGPFNAKNPAQPNGPAKEYRDAVKPFNFLEHVPLDPIAGRPPDIPREESLCLIRPVGEAGKGISQWVNIHDPSEGFYVIVAGRGLSMAPRTCIGRTYEDLILEHAQQPETKSAGPDGKPCTRKTVGLLGPRHIEVDSVVHIGKEANELELVQAGLVDEEERVLNVYERDLWEMVQPILEEIPAARIQKETGYSKREVHYLRKGVKRPSKKRLPKVAAMAAGWAREVLENHSQQDDPAMDRTLIEKCATFLADLGRDQVSSFGIRPQPRAP